MLDGDIDQRVYAVKRKSHSLARKKEVLGTVKVNMQFGLNLDLHFMAAKRRLL